MPEAIFRHFLIGRLRSNRPHGGDGGAAMTPVIRARLSSKQHSSEVLHNDVLKLCFPDAGDLHHSNRIVSEAYTFILNSRNGDRLFGFCRRHLHNSNRKPTRYLECLCMLTAYPFFTMFEQIMEHAQVRWLIESKSLVPFLKAVLSSSIPDAGKCLEVSLPTYGQQVCERFFFTRRKYAHMNISTSILLEMLSPDNLLVIMSALLCERRIIFSSKRLFKFPACVHACVSLLYPFRWQHVLIPVLSTSMLHLACAPMPFIIGVRERDLAKLMELPLEPVLIVRLDENLLQTYGGALDLVPFPSIASKLRSRLSVLSNRDESVLRKGIKTIMGTSTDICPMLASDELYCSFFALYLLMFGNWMRYMDKDSQGRSHYNFERFLDDSRIKSQGDFAFFQTIRHSLLFDSFIRDCVQSARSCHASLFTALSCTLEFGSEVSYSAVLDIVRSKLMGQGCGKYARIALHATSLNSRGVDQASFEKLANGTSSSIGLEEALSVIWARIRDCSGRQWRHGSLALRLLLHLMVQGSDAVLARVRDRLSLLVSLTHFSHKEIHVQQEIRQLADAVVQKSIGIRTLVASRACRYSELSSMKAYIVAEFESVDSSNNQQAQMEMVQAQVEVEQAIQTLHAKRRSREQFEFPTSEALEVIDKSNRMWAKYRIRSLLQRKAPIIPKFSRLHRKMAPPIMKLRSNICWRPTQANGSQKHVDHLLSFTQPPVPQESKLDPSNGLQYAFQPSPPLTRNPTALARSQSPWPHPHELTPVGAPDFRKQNLTSASSEDSNIEAILQEFDPFSARVTQHNAKARRYNENAEQAIDPLLDFSNLPKINRVQQASGSQQDVFGLHQ